jgi:anti-sigma factor RsiW
MSVTEDDLMAFALDLLDAREALRVAHALYADEAAQRRVRAIIQGVQDDERRAQLERVQCELREVVRHIRSALFGTP